MSPIQQMFLGVGASAKKTYIEDIFSVQVWPGTSHTINPKNIVNNLDLSTDGGLVWVKERTGGQSHVLFDTERGATKALECAGNAAEETQTDGVTAFNTNGFTVAGGGKVNDTGKDYGNWSWKKTPGFFDVISWTGDGDTGTGDNARSISHSLEAVPGMIIVKTYDEAGVDWAVYHRNLEPTAPYSYHLALNEQDSRAAANIFGNKAPTSTHIYVSDSGGEQTNSNNKNYVAYLFAGGEDKTTATACSVKIDNASDGLKVPDSSDFDFGSGDFTVECWVNFTQKETGVLLGQSESAWGSGTGLLFYMDAGDLKIYAKDTSGSWIWAGTVLGKLTSGQWNHVAVTRSSGVARFFLNGDMTYEETKSDTIQNVSDSFGIGWNAALGGTHNCRISNVRVIKGQAVYTAAFRPSTVPFTTTSQGATASNVKLLCCQSSTVTAATVSPGTITKDGTVEASLDSPFDDPGAHVFGESGSESVIKCGSYVGTATAGLEVYVGWQPQYLLMKNITSDNNWYIWDTMRGIVTNGNSEYMFPNTNSAEASANGIDLTSTGFKIRFTGDGLNGDGETYVYMAIRMSDGYCGKPIELGTGAFAMDTGDSSSYDSGFPVDFAFYRKPAASDDWWTVARLIQGKELKINTNDNESSWSGATFDSNDSWGTNAQDNTHQSWMWKRYAGMDCISFLGTGSAQVISHSMNGVPEFIILKNRETNSNQWYVYHKDLNNGSNPEDYYQRLGQYGNYAEAGDTGGALFNSTAPTSTHFSVGTSSAVNESGVYTLALLFRSISGISKVGTYTGNGSMSGPTITLGFAPRLIILKATDRSGSWFVIDSLRGIGSGSGAFELNTNAAQGSGTLVSSDSTSFTITSSFAEVNDDGKRFIYYAHA